MDDRTLFDYPFGVRVKFGEKVALIQLDWENIAPEAFANQVFKIKIDQEKAPIFKLTDNMGAAINKSSFRTHLLNFHRGSMFYVNVELEPTVPSNVHVVTPLMLENYFIQKNLEHLLSFKNAESVDKPTQRLLVNTIVDFMVATFGDAKEVTLGRRQMTARSTIILFPFLKYKDSKSDGTDLLIQDGGMFPNRLKYIANRKKMQQATEAMTIDDGTADSGNEHDIYSEADAIADLNILKRSVINDTTDMEMIKEKLNATRQYRLDLMKRHETDVRAQFPFFFSHPNLLLLDFKLSAIKNNKVPDALVNFWPQCRNKLRTVFAVQAKYAVTSAWDEEVEDLLIFLKVFYVSKAKKKPKTFKDVIDKLIVFKVIGTPETDLVHKSNNHPYLIAVGLSKDNILRYYVKIEEHSIPLPREITAIQAFDFLFKAYKVFNLNFDDSLDNMMMFLDKMLFKTSTDRKEPAVQMKTIYSQLTE